MRLDRFVDHTLVADSEPYFSLKTDTCVRIYIPYL